MAKIFKNPIEQSQSMLDIGNIDSKTLCAIEQEALKNASYGFGDKYQDVRNKMIEIAANKYGINKDYATILVDGGMSRPNKINKGKSMGIFESDPIENHDEAIASADEYLKTNPDAWGVLYGYRSNGKLHRLKNPISVKDYNDVKRYQNAIGNDGKSGTMVELQGRYR